VGTTLVDLEQVLVSRCGMLDSNVRVLTDPHSPLVAYTAVRTSLVQSPVRSIVVVLDCCFSGRAVGVLGALDSAVAVDLAQVHGGYVLTSAAGEELALAPPGARHTAFTGELIGLLAQGDPAGPPLLALRHAYQYLTRVLPAGLAAFQAVPTPDRSHQLRLFGGVQS
jgi:hypothetical protein